MNAGPRGDAQPDAPADQIAAILRAHEAGRSAFDETVVRLVEPLAAADLDSIWPTLPRWARWRVAGWVSSLPPDPADAVDSTFGVGASEALWRAALTLRAWLRARPGPPALHDLTADELDLICRCMRAILDGPWLRCRVEHHDPDCNAHVHARMGIDWSALAHALATLEDDPRRADGEAYTIARCALGEVGGGIRFTEDEWHTWIGAPRDTVEALHRRLREP